MKYDVALTSQTTGRVIDSNGDDRLDSPVEEGHTVTVSLRDENGNPITETGVVEEILSTCEDWQ